MRCSHLRDGILPAPLTGILGDLYDDLVLEGGLPVVSRDYRLTTSRDLGGGLYIQGNTEHSHGLTSSLLSNIAVRSAEILQSIDVSMLSPVGQTTSGLSAG